MNPFVKQAAAAGWLPWARWNSGGGLLVLTFHRVLPGGGEPPMQTLAVDPADLRALLEWMMRRWTPVGIDEWCAMGPDEAKRALEKSRGFFAVSFDDGWRDNWLHAAPVLRELGVPATVFLATGAVDERRPFWWQNRGLDDASIEEMKLSHAGRLEVDLRASPGDPGADDFLTWDDIAAWADAGGVRFGLHGHSHALLDALPRADALADIEQCWRLINAHVPDTARSAFFAWPNGNTRDDLVAELDGLGLAGAFSTRRGIVWPAMKSRWALPRYNVDAALSRDRRLWPWMAVNAWYAGRHS